MYGRLLDKKTRIFDKKLLNTYNSKIHNSFFSITAHCEKINIRASPVNNVNVFSDTKYIPIDKLIKRYLQNSR